jgi:DNA helicase HerA-like ATPase
MAVEKIVIGRNRLDMKKYSDRGTIFIGKHIVGQGEEAHLTNPICMDVVRPHVMLICGKRGSGKSYTGGVVAEEMMTLAPDIMKNLSILMIDTMGIYWSMKRPNEKDRNLLDQWGLKPNAMKNMKFFIPKGWIDEYKDAGIDYDYPFTLQTGEVTAQEWNITLGFNMMDDHGILTERVIKNLKKRLGNVYSIDDIIKEIEKDDKTEKKVKNALTSRFANAQGWGVFEKKGTPIDKFVQPGKISVIDISHYLRSSSGWSVRTLVIGLFARRIFQARLMARKKEELEVITGDKKIGMPMIWMIIDEAHQFVPNQSSTAASEPILTLIKEVREPRISLVLITQIPNKLHSDALAQSDMVISHRLTSEADMTALRSIMQSYMLKDIQELINTLPRKKGSAIVLDDNSERIYTLQVRPRFSWHAGGSPSAIKKKGLFD